MSKKILVVAPHPDDETLGVGGSLFGHKNQGHSIHWLIMSEATKEVGFSDDFIRQRKTEIKQVSLLYGFASTTELPFLATRLDTYPMGKMIEEVSKVFRKIEPEIIYLPHYGDVHSDHRITHQVVAACCKPFRFPFIKKVLAYETLSETDAALPSVNGSVFLPNVFVDISKTLEKKIEALTLYKSELAAHPFPRSHESVKALARLRGAASNLAFAEAFMLLREISLSS
ncbi:MAG: GlcNAc-PI de-N-acetylase [Deltaproteobacteria bacterium RIFCSPLOWO2_12_FULL_40_28]|nr:MAG: GlcNAc-PI de-N-acetylase [Deltaproteobacteria bacterium RIFCSPHIGHO2_02_FULL_40_28]OGQ19581.1 MAG: GlcNAc-PI de-N-acetylase [Deltaproteobacteria bacterium RIFCSPHIGHO2_12_FULL_40_32]OGQ40858.1 MAG: GlcNAc-PI de-N-acetylase [Deltaproteobacteria bacterium RIFCSPLOWO2_02_FULL_40_36]OGQ53973.1 MAG: GlcNAc-PI de-N-acetylase [Deltaproteobacteria bacterium RIFCSPLOWO2_12_FULL_40_28]